MIRLLQRMDDALPRHTEGSGPPSTPPLRKLTVLADANESAEDALEDWARGLDWVRWLFSSIRQRMNGLYFHGAALPQPSLYPRATLNRQALAARWENYTRTDLQSPLGVILVQAWQAARDQDLEQLLSLDSELSATLSERVRQDSLEAGSRLLGGTRGARYQGLLGRYRIAQEEGRSPGHFLIVWAIVGHFFQLSVASVIAEYLRLEWDLACRDLPCGTAQPLPAQRLANLTSQLMQSQAVRLHLLGTTEESAEQPQEAEG